MKIQFFSFDTKGEEKTCPYVSTIITTISYISVRNHRENRNAVSERIGQNFLECLYVFRHERAGGKANAGFGDYDLSFSVNKFNYIVFQTWSDEDGAYAIGVVVRNERKKSETRIDGLRETPKWVISPYRRGK